MGERLRRLAASRWADPAIAAVVAAGAVAELLLRPRLSDSPHAILTVVAIGATVAVRRAHPVAATIAASAVVLAAPTVDDTFFPNSGIVLTLLLSYACGAYAPGRSGLAAIVGFALAMQASAGLSEFPNIELYLPTLGGWWVGRQVRLRSALVRGLAERNRELEAEEDAFARLAVRRERARIARELHDIVAHHLAVIVVQAGAGRMAAPGDGAVAAQRFASIRQSGDQALAEMDRLVDILQAEGAARPRTLEALLDDARAGGLALHVAPLPDAELPPAVAEAAYRIVQEGLTNAIKHAPGAEVHVRLMLHGNELEVEVRDDGAGAVSALAETGAGLGLTGMRERVESLGGELYAGSDGNGWCVRARLPVVAPVAVTHVILRG